MKVLHIHGLRTTMNKNDVMNLSVNHIMWTEASPVSRNSTTGLSEQTSALAFRAFQGLAYKCWKAGECYIRRVEGAASLTHSIQCFRKAPSVSSILDMTEQNAPIQIPVISTGQYKSETICL